MDKALNTPITKTNRFDYRQIKETSQSRYQSLLENLNAKDYETLKINYKNLEIQNRKIIEDLQKIRYDYQYIQSKLNKELDFKELTFKQYQNQKNSQIDQMHQDFEAELHKVRRDKDNEYEQIVNQLNKKQMVLRQTTEKLLFSEEINLKLKLQIEQVEKQFLSMAEKYKQINQMNMHYQNKEGTLLSKCNSLERQLQQMQQQIRILLKIQSDKSNQIQLLKDRANKSQSSEQRLMDKLEQLSNSFDDLENNLQEQSNRIVFQQKQIAQLKIYSDKLLLQSNQKERQHHILISQYKVLKSEYEQRLRIDRIRQGRIKQLMAENQRLYREVNIHKHKLHELAVTYNFNN